MRLCEKFYFLLSRKVRRAHRVFKTPVGVKCKFQNANCKLIKSFFILHFAIYNLHFAFILNTPLIRDSGIGIRVLGFLLIVFGDIFLLTTEKHRLSPSFTGCFITKNLFHKFFEFFIFDTDLRGFSRIIL